MHRLWRALVGSLFAGALLLSLAAASLLVQREVKTGDLEARYLSSLAKELRFEVRSGPSAAIRFPASGPYDRRLGYASLPDFIQHLLLEGFSITAQARSSPTLIRLVDLGLFPIYREKTQAGLTIMDRDNAVLFSAVDPAKIYPDFQSIPPLVLNSLLFIENRELLAEQYPRRNPAVEWDRFGRAVLEQLTHVLGSRSHVSGGSTLATQLEKYRHSPEGRTVSVLEKVRQMASATVRAYLNGPETLEARQGIALAYLNSMPLSAAPGYGEVHGLADGLRVWHRADFDRVNRLLRGSPASHAAVSQDYAVAYRQVLSLLLAQRRPAFYLGPGWDELQALTDSHLRLMAASGVIEPALRDASLRVSLQRPEGPALSSDAYVTSKAQTVIRTRLASALGVSRLYDLDRLDLTAKSTLDLSTQRAVAAALRRLSDRSYAQHAGLVGFRLLGERDDLSRIIYSFTLYERTRAGNALRVQTDNYDQPLDINEGIRLELGSTAKLRTLVHYLEIIADLHGEYRGRSAASLGRISIHPRDRLSRWVIDQLRANPGMSLKGLLDSALERRYSANPGEQFYTGGGVHSFVNFNASDNGRVPSVREALRDSVNLVFIRLMRDIVYHYLYRPGGIGRRVEEEGEPLRRMYLERFADVEGRIFLRRFYGKYREKTPEEILDLLLEGVHLTPTRLATIYRSVYPSRGVRDFADFMRARLETSTLSDDDLASLYQRYSTQRFDLQDRGYIAHKHPLELWLAYYLLGHPKASLAEAIEASARERQQVYGWLFKTGRRHAQDRRIQELLEVEAFAEIHNAWKRLGYPFETLTPSYACAIGASGDRPAALAELIGILVNDGIRYPAVRFENLRFAVGTPYETWLDRPVARGERVLPSEVAAAARGVLAEVVDEGTAVRLKGAYKDVDGQPLQVGGKTGTGDNRREIFGPRGRLVAVKVINRTATFAFMLGNRLFGTLTAYVDGPQAAHYHFTSSLPVQVLRSLAPTLGPLIARAESPGAPVTATASLTRSPAQGASPPTAVDPARVRQAKNP